MTPLNRIGSAICVVISLFVVMSEHALSEDVMSVPIVVSPRATSVEQLAAQELAGTLVTTDARQIAITQVEKDSPADGILVVGDVILGVGWIRANRNCSWSCHSAGSRQYASQYINGLKGQLAVFAFGRGRSKTR